MRSCIYQGKLMHCRHAPTKHQFRYNVFMMYLDLAELSTIFAGRWFWSTRRLAIARFKREDHLGDPNIPLDEAVRSLVQARTGMWPTGPIGLLTNLRYLGYVMNPISIYYCLDETSSSIQSVVAEVHNTPWNEQHCYVLNRELLDDAENRTVKQFHVSPFMPMDMQYHWKLGTPSETLQAEISSYRKGELCFEACLALDRRELTTSSLNRVLLRHAFMPQRVWKGIYWQAFRLWRKGLPYFPHPQNAARH